jgi:hypothetical protein
MSDSFPSALITDQGTRVLLRLKGHFFELSQSSLRAALGLPDGPPGLGIRVERERLRFEFSEDGQVVEVSAADLLRRITRDTAAMV